MNRARNLELLADREFDLLVVGAGILGACVARDAALRGLSVALIDEGDFGGATSANSLKIVHGGLRYLQQLDLRRVLQSIRERSTWLRIAPHLIEPLPCLVPTYSSGVQRRAVLRAALAVNDAASWDRNRGLVAERRLPRGRVLSRREVLELVPELESRRLTGGALFHDAQMYSVERLVLAVVRSAAEAGAVVANYVACEGPLLRNRRLAGGMVRDREGGDMVPIRARQIVNVAGASAPDLASRLLGGAAHGAGMTFSVAVNVMVPPSGHAIAFALSERLADRGGRPGRQLFFTPWRENTLIGTGHFRYDGDPARFEPGAEMLERFLAQINAAWPGRAFEPGDVRLVHSGLMPTHLSGADGGPRLLRRPRIVDHARDGAPNLISAFSVKLTTARLLAQHVVDLAFRKRRRTPPPSTTATAPLPGAVPTPGRVPGASAQRQGEQQVEPDVLQHLLRCYGSEHTDVLELARDGRWGERVVLEQPVIRAQLAHAVREEMAIRVEDLLFRRTELGARGLATEAAYGVAAESLRAAFEPLDSPGTGSRSDGQPLASA